MHRDIPSALGNCAVSDAIHPLIMHGAVNVDIIMAVAVK
jgi:hypothetical protein